jgi:hypothetical protein
MLKLSRNQGFQSRTTGERHRRLGVTSDNPLMASGASSFGRFCVAALLLFTCCGNPNLLSICGRRPLREQGNEKKQGE